MKTKILAAAAIVSAALLSPRIASACSGYDCDYSDPNATGCSNSATTIMEAHMLYTWGIGGVVQLRYSTDCGTAWGRTVSWNGPAVVCETAVARSDGASQDSGSIVYTDSCYSNQLYDPAGVCCASAGEMAFGLLWGSASTNCW